MNNGGIKQEQRGERALRRNKGFVNERPPVQLRFMLGVQDCGSRLRIPCEKIGGAR